MAQQIPLVPLSSAPRTPGEAELFHALETIQPELMAMTRLFSLPDSLWGPPPAFALTVRADADAYTAAAVADRQAEEWTAVQEDWINEARNAAVFYEDNYAGVGVQ